MCRHNAAVPVDWCSLCARAAGANHTYSLRGTRWKGHPVVEILRDGQPFWNHSEEDFRFGRLKAKLIVASITHIHTFLAAPEAALAFPEPLREVFPQLHLVIERQTFVSFPRGGQDVHEPYMKVSAVPHDRHKCIGFGITKAGALVALERELWEWVAQEAL